LRAIKAYWQLPLLSLFSLSACDTSYISKRGSLAFIIDNWLDKIKWNVNDIYTECEENPRACARARARAHTHTHTHTHTHKHSYIYVKMSLTYITRADVKYDNAYGTFVRKFRKK